MANITLTPGTLPPPACYADDQERFEAYVASIVASITGGVQWEHQTTAPADLTEYWSQIDANERPVLQRKYSVADGKWIPWLSDSVVNAVVGGTGDAITLSNSPTFNSSSAFLTGRRFVFLSPGVNTGPVTLNVDGLGAKDLVKQDDDPLVAGDIISGQIVDVVYNLAADQFEMQTPPKAFALTAATLRANVTSNTGPVPGIGSSSAITHNVAAVPTMYWVKLRCLTSEGGYSVDDEVDPNAVSADQGSGSYLPAFTWSADDAAVTILGHSGNSRKIHSKSAPNTAVGVPFTAASWQFVLYYI